MEYEREVYRKETKSESRGPVYSDFDKYGYNNKYRPTYKYDTPLRYSERPVTYTTTSHRTRNIPIRQSHRPMGDDYESKLETDRIRKEWEDTFRRVAPRTDEWSLTDSISKRMVPVAEDAWDPSDTSFPEERLLMGKPSPITEDASGRRRFFVEYEVGQFKPEEIDIKTSGNYLNIHARSFDSQHGSSGKREYTREVCLPRDVNPELITARVTRTGRLTLEAPIYSAPQKTKDVKVPVLYKY